ncbi:CHAT domain-containing protein [Streptomyces goshikiensis]|uniref:CHAT domain-containing protein n=1 Tax=Streptomyces goshikiensis TaxID=1942 RepID=UPI0037B22ADA
MTIGDQPLPQPQLLYAVVFEPQGGVSALAPPVRIGPFGDGELAAIPHGLARDVARALPGLWYCLHLPGSQADLVDLYAWQLQGLYALARGHKIALVPLDFFEKHRFSAMWRPMLAVTTDDLGDRVRRRATELGFEMPTATFSELSDESLAAHWKDLHQVVAPGEAMLDGVPTLTRRLDLAAIDLPYRLLACQMGWEVLQPTGEDQLELIRRSRRGRVLLAATARLERGGVDVETADEYFPQAIKEEGARLRLPVTLGLPGVAPAYTRDVYTRQLRAEVRPTQELDPEDSWSAAIAERPDHLVERAAIEFLVTSRSVADGGLGLMMRSVPASAFRQLAQLEKHFVEAKSDKPISVWKMLRRLDAAARPLFTDPVIEAIHSASSLTVFTNFPLGLVTMPGDTAPLAARLPITYEPLLPLTQAIQRDFSGLGNIDWSNGIRVLIAECIPGSDPVGQISRIGWRTVRDVVANSQNVELVYAETLSVEALRAAVKEHQPDMLILSAHGRVRNNVAGLVIGEDTHITLGLDPAPAVVVLSACHVAPRGAGTVSVTDLLLREGASAVLGTQVPVQVHRNAMLTTRFLVNIVEAISEHAFDTLLDVWRHVQGSNTVNDILWATPSLTEWGLEPGPDGMAPLTEFMTIRSAGRLRGPHIYKDTEEVLGEIADDAGRGQQVRNWFQRPGYVPESLFYLFAGRPERIHLTSLQDRIAAFVPSGPVRG